MTPHLRSLVPILWLALLLSGCAAPRQQPSVADQQAEAQRIRQLDAQWVAAVGAKDVPRVAAFYAPDGRLMVPNAPPAEGQEAVRKMWAGILGLPNMQLTFQPTDVEVSQSGDLAYDVGTYSLSFDQSGKHVADQGKYVVVWKKVNGEWRVAADIFNSNSPAAR